MAAAAPALEIRELAHAFSGGFSFSVDRFALAAGEAGASRRQRERTADQPDAGDAQAVDHRGPPVRASCQVALTSNALPRRRRGP